MKRLLGRIHELERRARVGTKRDVVLRLTINPLGLDSDRCVEILTEYGFVQDDVTGINLLRVPIALRGAGAEAELKQYLREHGGEICTRPLLNPFGPPR